MPGIIPMKVIKVGNSAQTRIAQACDRCRSKKIRCDGFRPCCSQCAQVGFECKTSDKLSRRAFPRGYTESLEERVRALETEIKDLKDLLDAKDEKIDMLSRLRSTSPSANHTSAARRRRSSSSTTKSPALSLVESFKLHQPFALNDGGSEDRNFYTGNSSGRAFVDAIKVHAEDVGRPQIVLDPENLFPSIVKKCSKRHVPPPSQTLCQAPPRLDSDQMVNVFFQEWAPLFPILHRPTFLSLYERYVSDIQSIEDQKSLAQLHLVFGIAAISSNGRIPFDSEACELQWIAAVDSFATETSLSSLQCLALAQIFCIQKGDWDRVLYYKSLALGTSLRLGLHQPQEGFGLGTLTRELRKRLFWILYTLDCFSASSLGLPKLLKEEDIGCEYPNDVDDEYITEQGFQPSLPGECTKISSALALFRGARVLSKVLEMLYPSTQTYEVSTSQIAELDTDLDEWYSYLPSHLKLSFEQERPSTNIISSRCPLLSLTYHYIRTLIHRPGVCTNGENMFSSSLITLGTSGKHMIQILQLLEERNLSFSFAMNYSELVLLSGLGLIFQSLDLGRESKLLRDNQRTICSVIGMLERAAAPGAADFKRTGCALLSIRRPPGIELKAVSFKGNAAADNAEPVDWLDTGDQSLHDDSDSAAKHVGAIMSRLNSRPISEGNETMQSRIRRFHQLNSQSVMYQHVGDPAGRHSISTSTLSPQAPHSALRGSAASMSKGPLAALQSSSRSSLNLDYYSFAAGKRANADAIGTPESSSQIPPFVQDWDNMLAYVGNEEFGTEESSSSRPTPPYGNDSSDRRSGSSPAKAAEMIQDRGLTKSSLDTWEAATELNPKTCQVADLTTIFEGGPDSVLSFSDDSPLSSGDFKSLDFDAVDDESDAFHTFIHVGGDEEVETFEGKT